MHHGGSEVLVTTFEIGFGSYPIAIMHGLVLPQTSMVDKENLCKKPDRSIGVCSQGETIIGTSRIWDIASYGNGEFSMQITSNEYPYNTVMTKLFIR